MMHIYNGDYTHNQHFQIQAEKQRLNILFHEYTIFSEIKSIMYCGKYSLVIASINAIWLDTIKRPETLQ